MKVARFESDHGPAVGLVVGDEIVELNGVATVLDAVAEQPSIDERMGRRLRLDSVRLLPPIWPLVRNVFAVGWNYPLHFEEGRTQRPESVPKEMPERPTFFTKATGTVIGPRDPISLHSDLTQKLDWEVELAMVIGIGGSDITEADAARHIAGFMVGLDVTARDVSRAHGGQWFRGKSLDGTCPLGPWLVTTDEMGELDAKDISCRVNGEVVQSAVLGDMHFKLGRILAELTAGLSLIPGDIILTGTPPGAGFARVPPQFLREGDLVEAEIAGIGQLGNVVCA